MLHSILFSPRVGCTTGQSIPTHGQGITSKGVTVTDGDREVGQALYEVQPVPFACETKWLGING